jgi:hypothetical protein
MGMTPETSDSDGGEALDSSHTRSRAAKKARARQAIIASRMLTPASRPRGAIGAFLQWVSRCRAREPYCSMERHSAVATARLYYRRVLSAE